MDMEPYVTISIPQPDGPPMVRQIPLNGAKHHFIIGGGLFAEAFSEGDADNVNFTGDAKMARELNNTLGKLVGDAEKKMKALGIKSSGPAELPEDVQVPNDAEDLRALGFDDAAIAEHLEKQKQKDAEKAAADGAEPEQAEPEAPVAADPENTEERVALLESWTSDEDKKNLEHKKYALGLFRNAKQEGNQDLVDRICAWLGLPEMIVETQAPKA